MRVSAGVRIAIDTGYPRSRCTAATIPKSPQTHGENTHSETTGYPAGQRNFSARKPPTMPTATALVTRVSRRSMNTRTASP